MLALVSTCPFLRQPCSFQLHSSSLDVEAHFNPQFRKIITKYCELFPSTPNSFNPQLCKIKTEYCKLFSSAREKRQYHCNLFLDNLWQFLTWACMAYRKAVVNRVKNDNASIWRNFTKTKLRQKCARNLRISRQLAGNIRETFPNVKVEMYN